MTRCVVQLISGELGFSYSLGRDKAKAEQAALIDALLQTKNPNVNSSILSHIKVIEEKHITEKELHSRKAAATKVNFFTLVRGEG
jgi:alpha-D-ribose 1-methylphosphonate 5-triphosphate synthase subunit PhnG